MKRNYVKFILGSILTCIGIILLSLTITHWSISVKTIDSFPIIFGAEILFLLIGIVLFVTGIIEDRKISDYNNAKKANAREEDLFILEEKVKNFRQNSVMILCLPIPYLLLLTLLYYLIEEIKKGSESIFSIVVLFICLGFLGFICIGIIIAFIQSICKKKLQIQYVNGELKKIILANNIEIENNNVLIKQYRLLITYTMKNKKCEFLTQETFSQDQIEFIKKCVYIPLTISQNNIKINQEQLLKTTKNLTE